MTEGNAREVLRLVDGFAPAISSGASVGNANIGLAPQPRRVDPIESYYQQLAILAGGAKEPLAPDLRAKLIWNISLFDLSMREAAFFHSEVKKEGYKGIMLFRNYTKLGGRCSKESNQVIACLAWGDCAGRFGEGRQ
jgi:hypothetical protein